MGTTDDRESISEPLEVTAVSRIHGTRRIHEVTGGHEEDRIRVQEEPRGHHRTREGTAFAPVRDREAPGSNPGPPTNRLVAARPDLGPISELDRYILGPAAGCST